MRADGRAIPPGCATGASRIAKPTRRWVSIRAGANAPISSRHWWRGCESARSIPQPIPRLKDPRDDREADDEKRAGHREADPDADIGDAIKTPAEAARSEE